jgi:hypothetical protein
VSDDELTVDQLAQHLGISTWAVRGWIQARQARLAPTSIPHTVRNDVCEIWPTTIALNV